MATPSAAIPFLDLVTPHRELERELVDVLRAALASAQFVGGEMVERFEHAFAALCHTSCCVGVGSGTDALRFALTAAGVQPGDTVITVPNTFIATMAAIVQAGAHPAFVDVDERTSTMAPGELEYYLTVQCRRDHTTGRLAAVATGRPVTAVVPVHLYGQTADMDPILALAEHHGLAVVEDACQAQGAEYFSARAGAWRRAGSMGPAAAFSFYPGKNLGACGEAGAVTSNVPAVGERVRLLRDHGQSRKYVHDLVGYNGRLDAIQAGFLLVKLPHLTGWNEARRAAARVYDELLADVPGVTVPHVPAWSRPVHHLYVVEVDDRERVQRELATAGIGTGVHYPVPLHLTTASRWLGHGPGDFPVAERAATRVLSLPMFPGLSREQQQRVVSALCRSTTRRHAVDGAARTGMDQTLAVSGAGRGAAGATTAGTQAAP